MVAVTSIFETCAKLFQVILRGGSMLWFYLTSPLPEEIIESLGLDAGTTWLTFGFSVGVPLVLVFALVRFFTRI